MALAGATVAVANATAAPPAFGPGSTASTQGFTPTTIASGDFNGDGQLDLAVGHTNTTNITLFLGTAGGGLAPSTIQLPTPPFPCSIDPFNGPVTSYAYALVSVDLGGDGDDDLVVACRGTWSWFDGQSIFYGNNSSVVAFENQGGNLIPSGLLCLESLTPATQAQAYIPAAATIGKGDLDGDGDDDLVVPIGKSARELLNTPSGLVVGNIIGSSSNSTIEAVAIGKIIPGGVNEIALTDRLAETAQVWRRTSPSSSPTLFQTVFLPAGARPLGVAIGDLNSDGHNDLVIAGNAIVAGPSSWYRCMGSASGSLSAPIATALPGNGRLVTLADLNLDGSREVLVSNGNRVSLFSGAGSPLGEMVVIGAASNRAVGIAVADRNADCRPDVFFVNRDANLLQSHFNITPLDAPDCDGDGVVDWCEISLGLEADLNGDGIPDSCQGPSYDLNGDGLVNGADLAIVLGQWGPCPGCPGDMNDDGVVDGADLALLLGNWAP